MTRTAASPNISVFLAALLALSLTPATQAQEYDIVILNGRVIDPETKLDAVRNVGITDGKIAVITEDRIEGKDTINATGHVVAPGFIDTHTHSSDKFSIKMSMMDGVTTGLDLELGRSKSLRGTTVKKASGRSTMVKRSATNMCG